jgi:hypothetical protein
MLAGILDKPEVDDSIVPDNLQTEIELLNYLRKFAKRYTILHSKSSYYYKVINLSMMIPIISLTIIGGFVSIFFASNSSGIVPIITGIVQLVVAFATGLYNFLKIQELQDSHYFHYVHFSKLENNIKVQLIIGDTQYKDYVNLYVYVRLVREELNRLIEGAPPVPERIIDKYNNMDVDNDNFFENKNKIINGIIPSGFDEENMMKNYDDKLHNTERNIEFTKSMYKDTDKITKKNTIVNLDNIPENKILDPTQCNENNENIDIDAIRTGRTRTLDIAFQKNKFTQDEINLITNLEKDKKKLKTSV